MECAWLWLLHSVAFSSIPADYPVMCSEYKPSAWGSNAAFSPFEFYCHLDEGVPFTENCIGIRLLREFSIHLLAAITILKKRFSSSVVWGYHTISAANSGQNQGLWYNENVWDFYISFLKKKKVPQLRNLNCWHTLKLPE